MCNILLSLVVLVAMMEGLPFLNLVAQASAKDISNSEQFYQ